MLIVINETLNISNAPHLFNVVRFGNLMFTGHWLLQSMSRPIITHLRSVNKRSYYSSISLAIVLLQPLSGAANYFREIAHGHKLAAVKIRQKHTHYAFNYKQLI